MKRRKLIALLASGTLAGRITTPAKDPRKDDEASPRWGFLGDDSSLRETIKESGQVILVCVYQTSLNDVRPPFAEVVFEATVVQVIKGKHKMGDRISIRFRTDSLPHDEAERAKFIEGAAAKNIGSLRIAFLPGALTKDYDCEWLEVPAFDHEMLAFAKKNVK
jgi:hypothetical protein